MRFLRRASNATLLVGGAVVVAIVGGTAAAANGVLDGSGPVPAPAKLSDALAQAAAAPTPSGVTARIRFTNGLFPSGSLGGGSPLLAGATGRLWAAADGRFRLELQSTSGDAQIVGDGTSVTVYDATLKTAYRVLLPAERNTGNDPAAANTPPTAAAIQGLLDRVATDVVVSGATPTDVAGQPAYSVRVGPREAGGLLGAVEAAWDASSGVPLRVAIYPRGATTPALALDATDIAYGPVAASTLDISPPPDVAVQTIDQSRRGGDTTAAKGNPDPATYPTPEALQQKLGFTLRAPATIAGLPLDSLRTVGQDGSSALLVYGKGLGSLLVLERAATASANGAGDGLPKGVDLPKVSIGGASGVELATALGTVVQVSKDGVDLTVLGSVPAASAEAAVRDLVR